MQADNTVDACSACSQIAWRPRGSVTTASLDRVQLTIVAVAAERPQRRHGLEDPPLVATKGHVVEARPARERDNNSVALEGRNSSHRLGADPALQSAPGSLAPLARRSARPLAMTRALVAIRAGYAERPADLHGQPRQCSHCYDCTNRHGPDGGSKTVSTAMSASSISTAPDTIDLATACGSSR